MKYLVISDNHGQTEILQTIKEKMATKVDVMLHCGDSCLFANDEALADYQTVLGNCDFEAYMPKRVFNYKDDCVFLTHGHLYGVEYDLNKLSFAAKEQNANLIFFGHTHVLGVQYLDGCLYLNPGSISYPRGEYAFLKGTFVIVETTPTKIKVQYYKRNLQPVEQFYEFTR